MPHVERNLEASGPSSKPLSAAVRVYRTTSFEVSRSPASSAQETCLAHLKSDSILWVSLSSSRLEFGRDFESVAVSVTPSHPAPAR